MNYVLSSWHGYSKIYSVGHRAVKEYFSAPVMVQEKVDGSQFSFGLIGGGLRCRSRNKELILDAPDKLFTQAVMTVDMLGPHLHPGWTYRGEYLQRPKHNTLAYDRVPQKHIVLFDISTGHQEYAPYHVVREEASRLGLEAAPNFGMHFIQSPEEFLKFLDKDSFLGGTKVEGVVCKRYDLFGSDGRVLLAKYVSEAFKEKHQKGWKKDNKPNKEFIQGLGESFATEAFWRKAVQHLREDGKLQDDPKDIGPLIKAAQQDLREEWLSDITERVMKHVFPQIQRAAVRGLPEWYKQQLVEQQFA